VQMLKKGTKLYSILTGTCPRCHENSMYLKKNPYLVSTLFEMHKTCASCGLKYKMEPSFFYGAMYVSYAVCIAIAVTTFSISYFFFNSGLLAAFISIVITLVLFFPIIIRLSRNIWINLFVKYDTSKIKSQTD
jgi:uncharacterized protein (DUF983 family)